MAEIRRFDEKATNIDLDEEENPELLGTGLSEGTVTRVHGSVQGAGRRTREIALAEKSFLLEDPNSQEGYIKKILAKHQELKKRGLPTIPTMRIGNVDGQNKLFMTDLSQGGQNEVLSNKDWHNYKSDYYGLREGKYHGSDIQFHISNTRELSLEAAGLLKKLVTTGCIAHLDTFFLILNKQTGSARILIGDLSGTEFFSEDDVERSYHTRDTLQKKAYQQLRWFLDEMNDHLDKESQIDTEPLKQADKELFKGVLDGWEVENTSEKS